MTKPLKVSFLGRLRNYFLAGVLITAPLAITAYLAYSFVAAVDSWVKSWVPDTYIPDGNLAFSIPGIGIVVIFLGLILIGFLTANFFGRFFLRQFEKIVEHTPVIRTIYNALKQILETVLAQQSDAFRDVVLVEYPRKGIWMLGFVSGKTKGEVQQIMDDEMINVFIPTTPNPTSGFLAFVPQQDLTPLEISVEDAFKMLISSGIVTPGKSKQLRKKKTKSSNKKS